MGMQNNIIDPCIFFQLNENGGYEIVASNAKEKLMVLFECTNADPMKEYARHNINIKRKDENTHYLAHTIAKSKQ